MPDCALVVKTKYPLAGIEVLLSVAAVPVVVLVTADGVVVTLVSDVTSVPYPILYVTDGLEPFTTAITFEIVRAEVVNAKAMFSLAVGLSTVIQACHIGVTPLNPEYPLMLENPEYPDSPQNPLYPERPQNPE